MDLNDIRYTDRDEWFGRDKPAHEKLTNFPNLPYVKKGDEVITESWAILIYLAYEANRKDLVGEKPIDSVKIEQIHGVINDARTEFNKLLFDKAGYEEKKEKILKENVLPKLQKIDQNSKGKFLNGELSIVDF